MSVQSESGRVDYSKSDHAPKGQQMAGDVVAPSSFRGAKALPGAVGQAKNWESMKDIKNADRTNLTAMPGMAQRMQRILDPR